MHNSKATTFIGIGVAIAAAIVPVLAAHTDALHVSAGALAIAGAVVAALGKALGSPS